MTQRYFFNIFNGKQIYDRTGTELAGIHEIRLHMFSIAIGLYESEDLKNHEWEMEAVDERGRIVSTLSFGTETTAE